MSIEISVGGQKHCSNCMTVFPYRSIEGMRQNVKIVLKAYWFLGFLTIWIYVGGLVSCLKNTLVS